MVSVQISASIPKAAKEALAEVAQKTRRSQNQHIARAIEDHVKREQAFICQVEEGKNSLEFATHSAVEKWLDSWGDEKELAVPSTIKK